MSASKSYIHPRDRHVLVSSDLTRIPEIIRPQHKAGIFPGAANQELKEELRSFTERYKRDRRRCYPLFLSPAEAAPLLRDNFSTASLQRLSEINHGIHQLAEGRRTGIVISANFCEVVKLTLRRHFEGTNPRGPSWESELRANLSLSLEPGEDLDQMKWYPANDLNEADIDLLLDGETPDGSKYIPESLNSGDLAVLWGLSSQFPNRREHGLLHVGPTPHNRASIVWGTILSPLI